MPMRNADAFPEFVSERRQMAPADWAISAVPSRDPSSIRTTACTCFAAPRTTSSMWAASLKAGISAQTLISDAKREQPPAEALRRAQTQILAPSIRQSAGEEHPALALLRHWRCRAAG